MAQACSPHQRVVAAAERREIATYRGYAEARRAVDFLSDRGFPVGWTAIVAEDLQPVEQVAGKSDGGRALREGAGTGAFTGAFFGFAVGLFDPLAPLNSGLTLVPYGLLFGAAVGALFGLFASVAIGGRRDVTPASGFRAGRYTIVVDDVIADDAAQLLAGPARVPRRLRRL